MSDSTPQPSPAAPPPRAVSAASPVIHLEGVRVHNLRNLTLDIPRNQLVTMTGLSGSGKSSLAFDTLHAEGQRRYLEQLSAGGRQLAGQLPRPDIDLALGLPPTISVQQRPGTASRRATLASLTEVHDFFRLLFARAGQAHCPDCGNQVARQSQQEIVDRILQLPERQRVMILAPLIRGRRGSFRQVFEQITRDGFVRARVDGEVVDAADPPPVSAQATHFIEAVIDRIVIREGIAPRLQESVTLALSHGNGSCLVSWQEGDTWQDRLFSERFACPDCDLSFPELEPRDFSFNNPWGACPACQGLGVISTEDSSAAPSDDSAQTVCPACHGTRLKPFPRQVRFRGRTMPELLALPVSAALEFFEQTAAATDTDKTTQAAPTDPSALVLSRVLPGILSRLRYLEQAGLAYLQLDRPARTLSGGEFQRARLAACLGSGLTGVCYILDEPTTGLHPRDTGRLLDTLESLRAGGNSLVIVEHDVEVMRRSDWLIDIGPGAGEHGGRIVAQGTPAEIALRTDSATGRALAGESGGSLFRGRPCDTTPILQITSARLHNLQEVTVDIPLGRLVCVTGVSGSGKSTLIRHCLLPLLREQLARQNRGGRTAASAPEPATTENSPDPRGHLSGAEQIERLLEVDQAPLGRNSRSCPATHSGAWNEIRRAFSRTREARARGWKSRRFSFNAAGGRCETCRGQGTLQVSMNLLPDLETPCPDCLGQRFNRQTLEVRFAGLNVADILNLPFETAAEVFRNFPKLSAICRTFEETGLGYLRLGQSALTLSGGEAQRIRLATELARAGGEHALIVLDEPTSGLHPADVTRLTELLQRLVDSGHTVLVIEHQLDLIAAADHIIDLGPDGGAAGGQIVATGPPANIATTPESLTGQALRNTDHSD